MIELLIAGAAGGIVMFFIMIYCFMCHIESGSNKNQPVKIFGVNYWFMTQDQIQKAVKAIILFDHPEHYRKHMKSMKEMGEK